MVVVTINRWRKNKRIHKLRFQTKNFQEYYKKNKSEEWVKVKPIVEMNTKFISGVKHDAQSRALVISTSGNRGSSVSTVPGNGMDNREIEVRYLAEVKEFFLYP
jgi:hypothetical protein